MFCGVVLAGGRSSRMGADKAGLPWRGRSLLEHMRELLWQAGAARVLTSGPYPDPSGLPDRQPGLGPLGGLLALAQTQPDGIYLLVPVDMPLLRATLLRRLVAMVGSASGPACASCAGHVLPLCLRLDTGARAIIEQVGNQLRQARSLRALHGALDGGELVLVAAEEGMLINCNTPEEWQRVTP